MGHLVRLVVGELAQVGLQGCLVLEVLGKIRPRAGRLLDGLSRGTQAELRADNFYASDDFLHAVWVLIMALARVMIWHRLAVPGLVTIPWRLPLLLLGLGLVHLPLQLLHPSPEGFLALLVDPQLEQLFVLLRHPHLSSPQLVWLEMGQIVPEAIIVPEDLHALRV